MAINAKEWISSVEGTKEAFRTEDDNENAAVFWAKRLQSW